MALNALIESFRDPYQQKARVFPGLLTALPLLVPFLWILGPRSPSLTVLLTLVTSCGTIYSLASVARGRGKKLEEKLQARWGGMPTTIILRHRDTFIDEYSKTRYRAAIKATLGVDLPTQEEEARDPAAADRLYSGVTRHLRELTRGKEHPLLLKENIAYGFHRNMLAMKPLGVSTSILGIAFGLLLTRAVEFSPLRVQVVKILSPGAAGGITLFVATVVLISWTYFTEAHLKRIGYAYAERLFESVTGIKPRRSHAKSAAK